MPSKGKPLNPTLWRFAGSLYFASPKADGLAFLNYQFNSRIIQTATEATSQPGQIVRSTWRRAAYLRQLWQGAEVSSHVVPLNGKRVFELSDLPASYTLEFEAVDWLPNLKILVWEYQDTSTSLETLNTQIAEIKALTELLL